MFDTELQDESEVVFVEYDDLMLVVSNSMSSSLSSKSSSILISYGTA